MTIPVSILVALAALTSTFAPARSGQAAGRAAPPDAAVALRRTFEQLAEEGFSGSVLVVRGDEVLLDGAAGLGDRARGRVNATDTIYDIGSITKQFTAVAILRLAQDGQLSIDHTIDRVIPGVPADKKEIRLLHLLTHTSGLPADLPIGSETRERDQLVRACLSAKMRSRPGQEFVYNNAGYCLLAAVVEIVSKQPFEDYVREHLFRPAGLASSGFLRSEGVDVARVANGYEGRTYFGPGNQGWYSWGLRGAGGVLSTTGDLMRWWNALQGDAILTKASRERLFRPNKLDYALGWWVHDDPVRGRRIEHGGTTRGFEGQFVHDTTHAVHVVVLCNDRGRSQDAADALFAALLGKSGALPAGAPPPEAELAAYAGTYELARGGSLGVRADVDALTLVPDDRAIVALELGSADAKLDANKALAERARRVVELLDDGDAPGLEKLTSTRWPGWNRTMVDLWKTWRDARGKLKKTEVLGSSGEEKTLVRLVHENRSIVFALRWEGGVFSGWSIDGGLPEAGRFRWRGQDSFALRIDPTQGSGEIELAFERDASGAVKRLTLKGGALDVSGRRTR